MYLSTLIILMLSIYDGQSLNTVRYSSNETLLFHTQYFQPLSVVNHPSLDTDFTQILEYKHLLNQRSLHAVYFIESSTDDGEPCYPVPNDKNQELFEKYQSMAKKENGVYFVGRNMD